MPEAAYIPSPLDIAIATAAIRRTWTAADYGERAGLRLPAWTPPTCAVEPGVEDQLIDNRLAVLQE